MRLGVILFCNNYGRGGSPVGVGAGGLVGGGTFVGGGGGLVGVGGNLTVFKIKER